jgi:hypothetical protein
MGVRPPFFYSACIPRELRTGLLALGHNYREHYLVRAAF